MIKKPLPGPGAAFIIVRPTQIKLRCSSLSKAEVLMMMSGTKIVLQGMGELCIREINLREREEMGLLSCNW
jgi:hypothetical protein